MKMDKIHQIVIKTEPLEKDPGNTSLVCQLRDGTFHQVDPVIFHNVEPPEGWQVINAIKGFIQNREIQLLIEVE